MRKYDFPCDLLCHHYDTEPTSQSANKGEMYIYAFCMCEYVYVCMSILCWKQTVRHSEYVWHSIHNMGGMRERLNVIYTKWRKLVQKLHIIR